MIASIYDCVILRSVNHCIPKCYDKWISQKNVAIDNLQILDVRENTASQLIILSGRKNSTFLKLVELVKLIDKLSMHSYLSTMRIN